MASLILFVNWCSYTIIRVAGYNSDLGTDSSVVRLQKVILKHSIQQESVHFFCKLSTF